MEPNLAEEEALLVTKNCDIQGNGQRERNSMSAKLVFFSYQAKFHISEFVVIEEHCTIADTVITNTLNL